MGVNVDGGNRLLSIFCSIVPCSRILWIIWKLLALAHFLKITLNVS